MKIYLVGGAVRDSLLGREVADRDYVVVGASPEDLLALGFKQVGASFPVFLHPETQEEYALARTERKTGEGYHGFKAYFGKDVSLEEDLRRRDLTINAMAQDLETGEIIDPYSGQQDLKHGVLRHVSEAFAEDPLRVLRVARFAAKLNFIVATETRELMRELVAKGEMKHLTKERVWKEIERGLAETNAGKMFDVLNHCGALQDISLFAGAYYMAPTLNTVAKDCPTKVKFLLAVDLDAPFDEWKLPSAYRDAANAFSKVFKKFVVYDDLSPEEKVQVINIVCPDGVDKHGILEALMVMTLCNPFRVFEDYQKLKALDLAEVSRVARENKQDIKSAVLQAKVAALS